jgi:NADPH:quinone reductase-like Zn-dependent oxidoreductase
MRAAIFDEPGLNNLKVMDNVNKPQINDHDVLVRVKVAGVNPIDNFVVSGALPTYLEIKLSFCNFSFHRTIYRSRFMPFGGLVPYCGYS